MAVISPVLVRVPAIAILVSSFAEVIWLSAIWAVSIEPSTYWSESTELAAILARVTLEFNILSVVILASCIMLVVTLLLVGTLTLV